MIGGGVGGNKSTKTEKSQTDPWEPAQPLLKDVLGKLGAAGNVMPDGSTEAAIDDYAGYLKGAGAAGGKTMSRVGNDLIDTPDRTGEVTDAYGKFDNRMSGIADGTNQDLSKNTYLQSLLAQVGDDAQNRINAQFAGAGRDMSGANNIEVGKGVTQAQLPILLDQFNREVGRSDAAARDLFTGGQGAAVAKTGMDVSRAGVMSKGAEMVSDGATAGGANLEAILALMQGKEKLPFDRLGWLTELLYPAAGLGQQSEGTASQKGSKWGLSGSAKIY